MQLKPSTRVEYMCKYCGQKSIRTLQMGRPLPGNCSRKPKRMGKSQPHSWVINRKMG